MIPVNTIRKACGWFGVLVDTVQGQKLFARREPGEQKSTGDMYLLEGSGIKIPKVIPDKNFTVDGVKRKLDELSNLTALDFDTEGSVSGYRARPSFRDLSAFLFQPQNIVANPNVLFYKADTHEHREKLRTIFPYILGAVTPHYLASQHELAQVRRDLRKKESELANVRQVTERWLADIRARVVEARELGLIENLPEMNAPRSELVLILQGIVESKTDDLRASNETISDALEELRALNEEERELSVRLSSLRKRQTEMIELQQSAVAYRGALQIQRDRLGISDWISGNQNRDHDCPVCGNSLESATGTVTELQNALREIEQEAGIFEAIPASFDREFQRVRQESDRVGEQLKALNFRIKSLESSSEEAKKLQYASLAVSRFLGNVEQALQTYAQLGTDSELATEVVELKDREKSLQASLTETSARAKIDRALQSVNLNAGRLLPLLDVERPDDPVELMTTDLTLRVNGVSRSDYLWEIGSGSNWLAYHIAITLALHQFFLELDATPVPTFIVYDQPSQVYFPKHLKEDFDETRDHPDWKDDDVEALHRVFKVFSQVVGSNFPNFQIMVLDHAPDRLWNDLEHINLVEEWRYGLKLVPEEWL
ncbi:MAG: DUF3732 domain-containing protein [Acidobacteriota bacterium]